MDRFIGDDLDALTTREAAFGKGLVRTRRSAGGWEDDAGPAGSRTTRLRPRRCRRLPRPQAGCLPRRPPGPDLRAAIDAQLEAHGLVLLSSICAQAVAKLVGIKHVAVTWIERTSLDHIERDERDFAGDHHAKLPIPGADEPGALNTEVEAYASQYRARETCSP